MVETKTVVDSVACCKPKLEAAPPRALITAPPMTPQGAVVVAKSPAAGTRIVDN